MTLTGFAVCAHTFVRISLYAQEHTRDSYGVLTANLIRMSWLRALSKGCQCWCWCCDPGCWWLSARLRRTAVLVGCWRRPRVSWQSAPVLVSAGCARCGGAVSWLCVQAVYILVPASRIEQVVGCCLAIWVYAGLICCLLLQLSAKPESPVKWSHAFKRCAFFQSLVGRLEACKTPEGQMLRATRR